MKRNKSFLIFDAKRSKQFLLDLHAKYQIIYGENNSRNPTDWNWS